MSFIYSRLLISRRIITQPYRLCFCKQQEVHKKTLPKRKPSDHEMYLESALKINSLNMEGWIKLKKDISTKFTDIYDINKVILKTAIKMENYSVVHSFITYLNNARGDDLSIGVTDNLLHFYYKYAQKKTLSNLEKQSIINIYNKLFEKYDSLDPCTGENLLLALCSANEWQKGIKVLDDIFLKKIPRAVAFNMLIATLFKNNEKVEALKFIEIALSNNRELLFGIYNEWVQYILRNYSDRKSQLNHLNEIVALIISNFIVIDEKTAELLKNTYFSLSWEAKFTTIIKQSGRCVTCNKTLNCFKLSQKEFKLLQNYFTKNMTIGQNLFVNTSADELQRLSKFIKTTGPYDIIIDGLNIALAGNGHYIVQNTNHVVDYFSNKKKKILFIGMNHMIPWLEDTFKILREKMNIFLIKKISEDDPFFITAAMLSGPHTDFVTNDLLRNYHIHFVDENLKLLLRRWQWQHQWMYIRSNNSINSRIQEPLCFTPWPQKNGRGWHLPYRNEKFVNETVQGLNTGLHHCSNWLCLMPKSRL